jgi:hypothetical protein
VSILLYHFILYCQCKKTIWIWSMSYQRSYKGTQKKCQTILCVLLRFKLISLFCCCCCCLLRRTDTENNMACFKICWLRLTFVHFVSLGRTNDVPKLIIKADTVTVKCSDTCTWIMINYNSHNQYRNAVCIIDRGKFCCII